MFIVFELFALIIEFVLMIFGLILEIVFLFVGLFLTIFAGVLEFLGFDEVPE